MTEEQLAQAQIAVSQAQAGTEIELDQVEHVETDQDGIRQVTAELHVPPEVMHLNVDWRKVRQFSCDIWRTAPLDETGGIYKLCFIGESIQRSVPNIRE